MNSRMLAVSLKSWAILFSTGFSAAICLFALNADVRYVLAPVAATLFIAFSFWLTLSRRRENIPLADPGTLTVLAIVLYTIIPSLQFLLSGMEHTLLSAPQLYALAPTPKEFGAFTWWYVIYLLSFVTGYLVFDSKSGREYGYPMPPDRSTVRSFFLLFIFLSAIMFAIEALYGINLYGVYDIEKMYDSYETFLAMPLLFRQFYGIIGHNGIFFIVKLGLLLTIFLNWKKPAYRYVLYIWLLLLITSNILWTGARTELVLTFIASVIMYHQFVKPLRLTQILPVGIILFAGFMIMGLIRGAANIGANLEILMNVFDSPESIFSIGTEFQVLFAGNYDLFIMKQGDFLGEIPLQFMLYDFVMIIPQQILPFEKLDVQQWIINQSNNFFMFNPISQSIMGFGWLELILRGLFLGFFFAKVRAWYIRRTSNFWVTLFYFYVTIISYYTIRGTAIYVILVSILFRFFPLYLLVAVIFRMLREGASRPAYAKG